MRRSWRRCYYCGAEGAQVRKVGEQPTCRQCGDLPAKERAEQLDLERELERHYNGEHSGR